MTQRVMTGNQFSIRAAGHETWLLSHEKEDIATAELKIDLSDFEIPDVTLSGRNLSCIELVRCRVVNSLFSNCDFSYATLYETVFENCTFERCSFVKAEIQDGGFPFTTLSECDLTRADLARASLRGATLIDCNLNWAWLYETDLRDAALDNVNLVGAKLIRTKVYGLRKLVYLSHDLAQIQEVDISPDANGTEILGSNALEVLTRVGRRASGQGDRTRTS